MNLKINNMTGNDERIQFDLNNNQNQQLYNNQNNSMDFNQYKSLNEYNISINSNNAMLNTKKQPSNVIDKINGNFSQ
jgi:hypothetical protein